MSNVIEILSVEEFNNEINSGVPVIVDFYATWCGPCKMQAPILHEFKDEMGDKVDANQKEEVKKLRDELQNALNNNDMETLKNKLDALEKAAQEMSAAMYQQQAGQANGAEGFGGASSTNDDDVVDADFKEV